MPSLKKRAWLTLGSMCPAYCVYFIIQGAFPELVPTLGSHLIILAAVACFHAVTHAAGLIMIKQRERGEKLLEDERDRMIDARATRWAYFFILAGLIYVGVVLPFAVSGWTLVNASLAAVVLSETLRHGLIVLGYRRRPRFAH